MLLYLPYSGTSARPRKRKPNSSIRDTRNGIEWAPAMKAGAFVVQVLGPGSLVPRRVSAGGLGSTTGIELDDLWAWRARGADAPFVGNLDHRCQARGVVDEDLAVVVADRGGAIVRERCARPRSRWPPPAGTRASFV
jgi:hypothetical protein